MRNNVKKAFTLVELIVVITILAILGTIAFLSLQGYSSDARNSKRSSDLGSISSAISTIQTSGTSLISFIGTTSTGNVSATSIIAGTGNVNGTDYKAGTPNYTTLGIKSADFKDPSGTNEYLVGVTTKLDGKYEVVAAVENGAGNGTAKVMGTYSPRTAPTAVGTVQTGSGSFKLTNQSDVGKFKRGDLVVGGVGSGSGVVSAISSDGMTLTINTASLSGTTLNLGGVVNSSVTEIAGLTSSTNSGTTYITDNGFYLPY